MKKFLSILLACMLLIGMTGLTATAEEATTTAAGTYTADNPYHLTFAYIEVYKQDDAARAAVAQAINDYMIPTYHIEVELLPLEYAQYQSQIQLMIQGGDPLDVIPIFYPYASGWIGMDGIVDMNPYMETEDGAKIIEALGGEANAHVGTMSGVLFGFPANKESVELGGLCMRADICDELGITEKYGLTADGDTFTGKIYPWSEAESIFDTVLAAYPNMIPLYMYNSSQMARFAFFDSLADSFGVLDWEADHDSTTVVNEFETETYKNVCLMLGRWMDKGYIFKDAATDTQGSATMMKAGNTFSYLSAIKPGFLSESNANNGQKCYCMYFGDHPEGGYSTTNVSFFDTGIASNSEDPEMAFKFIAAMYSDAYFYNLWQYGIQDVNYKLLDDGTAYYVDGEDGSNVKYHQNSGWCLGNQFQSYVWQDFADGQPVKDVNYWEKLKHHNDWAQYSPAYGFMWDSTDYQTQLTALNNVLNQYRPALETGTGGEAGVEATLKAMNDALYAAGLQTVIDAKQEQLNAWLEANGGPTQTPQANLDVINSAK